MESTAFMPHVRTKYKLTPECPLHPEKEWRWIPGFEGRFMVSTCGDVRMHQSYNGCGLYTLQEPRILHQTRLKNRYMTVHIQTERKRRHYYVHRLVLLTFHGEAPPKHEGAHLDGTRTNNHLLNLRWVTTQENSAHTHRHGTCKCGERHPHAKLTNAIAEDIRDRVAQHADRKVLAQKYNVCTATIDGIIAGRLWAYRFHLKN